MSPFFFLWVLLAYTLGSLPVGLWTGLWVKGIDVRRHGSGNLGATNVFRVIGKGWGLFVLILDALKGYAAVWVPVFFSEEVLSRSELIFIAAAAILGHAFPVWLRFRGGKGVATSLGVFLGLAPLETGIALGVWILCFAVFRIISLASLIAALCFPALVYGFGQGREEPMPFFILSILLALLIFFTHRTNIRRLFRGEEKKLF